MALVLADGSAALCRGAGEASPLVGLSLSHWVVVPPARHATCARIGWLTQTVAVGCSNGEVAIFRCDVHMIYVAHVGGCSRTLYV